MNEERAEHVLPQAVQRIIDRLGRAAAGHNMYLVVCSDHIEADSATYNTAFFLGCDGKEIGRYHKTCPTWSESGSRERGSSFPVFDTPDLGTVGLAVCYDLVMPETARCLALQGADIIFFPTMGGAAIGDDDIEMQSLRVRAAENHVYLAVAFRGAGSRIISPRGRVLATADGADGLAIADIDPHGGREGGDSSNTQKDMRSRLFRERNPEAFRILTDSHPPVLDKIPPIDLSREEAGRIFARMLTVGDEEFNAAGELVRAGKTKEAIAAFERLRTDYPGTWIDRVSRQRLTELGAPSTRRGDDPSPDEVIGPIQTRATGPLRKHPTNGRYFTNGSGQAIYLTGSHTWANLQDSGIGSAEPLSTTDPPAHFDYTAYLNLLQANNHNFIRLWRWELPKASHSKGGIYFAEPHPWVRSGPGTALDGKPKFDLNQFDPSYFERLRSRVMSARERGIYVSVMLFEGWYLRGTPTSWQAHPFHGSNNINDIDGDANGDGEGEETNSLQVAAVFELQKAYVRRVIDTVNDLDNVLFEIANESAVPGSTEWQYELVKYVSSYEATKPGQHPVGMTQQAWGSKNDSLVKSSVDGISPGQISTFDNADDPFIADFRRPKLDDILAGVC